MARYDLGTHGNSIQIHNEDRPIEILRHVGGTRVRQIGRGNYFFFSLPTPTVLRNETRVECRDIRLQARTNQHAHIDRITVYSGSKRKWWLDIPDYLTGEIDLYITRSSRFSHIALDVNDPLLLCIHVEFEHQEEFGEINFVAANAIYEC